MNAPLQTEAEYDLALAAALQTALLPAHSPVALPGQIAGCRNRMCAGLGGDFYDFIPINAEQTAVVIGDVIGHGVRAALVMAQIMGFLRSTRPDRSRPVRTVTALNHMLIDLGERTGTVLPVSILYAVFDAPTGVGFFVNAGHPRPLLSVGHNRPIDPVGPHSTLLGVEALDFEEACLTFGPGHRLVLYTDGLTDAAGADDERFGYDRLIETLSHCGGFGPQRCADETFSAVDAFRDGRPRDDDETIVVVDRV